MRTRSRGFLKAATLLAAALFIFNSSAVQGAEKTVMAGKVVSVEGRVLIRPEQTTGGRAAGPLKPGDVVKAGDVINTASNGSVKILLEDKTILDLGPSALFRVQKFETRDGGNRQVDIEMPYGTVRAAVSKPITGGGKFQIRTKTATMGVRGTEFIVQSALGSLSKKDTSSAPETKITVVQGKVEVAQKLKVTESGSRGPAAAAAPVMLTAGTQLTANASSQEAAKPVKLSTSELSAVTAVAQVKDNTFTKAITFDNTRAEEGPSNGNGNNASSSSGGGGSGANSGSSSSSSGSAESTESTESASSSGGESSASGESSSSSSSGSGESSSSGNGSATASSGAEGGGGGEGSGSSAGQATRDAISVAIATPQVNVPTAPITPQLPVAPKPQALTPFIPIGGIKHIRVVVTQ